MQAARGLPVACCVAFVNVGLRVGTPEGGQHIALGRTDLAIG